MQQPVNKYLNFPLRSRDIYSGDSNKAESSSTRSSDQADETSLKSQQPLQRSKNWPNLARAQPPEIINLTTYLIPRHLPTSAPTVMQPFSIPIVQCLHFALVHVIKNLLKSSQCSLLYSIPLSMEFPLNQVSYYLKNTKVR